MLINKLPILFPIILFASCATQNRASSPASTTPVSSQPHSVEFINDIAINSPSNNSSGRPVEKLKRADKNRNISTAATNIESFSPLQFKYAILTNAPVEEMNNSRLLFFMEDWYGVPYQYGGTTKNGIDCSAFVSSLLSTVYGITNLPRMSRDQYAVSKHIDREDIQEGDLVFFHTQGKHKGVTHVGVYLRNNKFIHASVSGVMISDMGSGYYFQHLVGCARPINAE